MRTTKVSTLSDVAGSGGRVPVKSSGCTSRIRRSLTARRTRPKLACTPTWCRPANTTWRRSRPRAASGPRCPPSAAPAAAASPPAATLVASYEPALEVRSVYVRSVPGTVVFGDTAFVSDSEGRARRSCTQPCPGTPPSPATARAGAPQLGPCRPPGPCTTPGTSNWCAASVTRLLSCRTRVVIPGPVNESIWNTVAVPLWYASRS
jgi:hypothetical protein